MEERKFDFKSYMLAFFVLSLSVAFSFFIGFRIGKNVAREELRKEVLKTKETELGDVLKKIFEEAEKKAQTKQREEIQNQEVAKYEEGEKKEREEGKESSFHDSITEAEGEKERKTVTQKLKHSEEIVSEKNSAEKEKNVAEKVEKTEKSLKSIESKERKELEQRQTEKIGGAKEVQEIYPEERRGEATITGELRGRTWWESNGRWTVQVASFGSSEKAEELARKLKRDYGFPAYVVKGSAGEKIVWRVRVGKLREKKDAEKLLGVLKQKGFDGIVTF